MVDFRPFRAVRYAESAGPLDSLICPPYDVILPSDEQELLARSPYNMVRMELAELTGPAPTERYTAAATALQSMLAAGVLVRDDSPGYYVLRQRFRVNGVERSRITLLGALHLEELGTGVLPHEDTAPGPKEDRLELMRAAGANFSPLMMLYRDESGAVGRTLATITSEPPTADFTVGGEEYTVWIVSAPDVTATIAGALAAEDVYIADGHHRYETALTYQREAASAGEAGGFVLTGLIGFDDPGLLILPYYRVVRNATPAQLAKLRDILSLYFVARPAGVAAGDASALDAVVATLGQGQVTLGVVDKGRPLQVLTPANDIIPEPDPEATPQTQVRSVEAFVLQEMLLRPVFGDAFPDHVAYVHEGEQAMEMVEHGDGQVAFFVKGLPPNVFKSVVGAGIRLPRKSTYFYPKLPGGVAVNLLEGEL